MADKILEVTLLFTDPLGLRSVEKKIKGTMAEIQAAVKALSLKSIDSEIGMTSNHLSKFKRDFENLVPVIQKSERAIVALRRSVKGMKGEQNSVGKTRGYEVDDYGKRVPGGRKADVKSLKKESRAQTRLYRSNPTAENTPAVYAEKLSLQLNKQKNALINAQKQALERVNQEMKSTGFSTEKNIRDVKTLTDNIKKIQSLNMHSLFKKGNDTLDLQEFKKRSDKIRQIMAEKKGQFRGSMADPNKAKAGSQAGQVAKLDAFFNSQKAGMINSLTQAMHKLQTQINQIGGASVENARKMQVYRDSITQLNAVDLKSVVNNLGAINSTNLSQAIAQIKAFTAAQKGMIQGNLTPLKGKNDHSGEALKQAVTQVSGAAGFGTIDVGLQIQNMFGNKRMKGMVASAAGNMASTIGGAFSGAIGSIAGNIGTAIGTLGELALNLFTQHMRLLGVAVGAFTRGVGIVIASGIVGSIASGLTLSLPTLIPILSAIIVPILFALVAVVQEFIAELLDIVSKLFKALVEVVSAGLKLIALVITTVMKTVVAIWNSLWDGLVSIVKEVTTSVVTMTKMMAEQVMSFIANALGEYKKLEAGALRASKEIANQGMLYKEFANDINKIQFSQGFETADIASGFFDIVSSGFRSTAERVAMMSAASRLAIADTTGVANAVNALITVYTTYGNKLNTVSRIGNLLSTSTSLGRTSLEELGPALRSVAGIAKFSGLALEDMVASITALTTVFGRGSTQSVTRYLSRFIEAIASPAASARAELDKLGISIKDLGGGNFSDSFVKMLDKLKKGVDPSKISSIFRTNQSRKAFIGLTQNIGAVSKILKQFGSLAGLQQAQINANFYTFGTRVKQVAGLLKNARTTAGGFVADIARLSIFSDGFMKVWSRVSGMLTNRAFTTNVTTLANLFARALLPATQMFGKALDQVTQALRAFSVTDLSNQSSNIMMIAKAIEGILTSITGVVTKAKGMNTLTDNIHLALAVLAGVLKQIDETLDRIVSSKNFNFDGILNALKEFGVRAGEVLMTSISGFLNFLSGGILKAATGLSNVKASDFEIDFSGMSENQANLIKSIQLLLKAIWLLFKALMDKIVALITNRMRDAFVQSTNALIERLKSTLDLLIEIENAFTRTTAMNSEILTNKDNSRVVRGSTQIAQDDRTANPKDAPVDIYNLTSKIGKLTGGSELTGPVDYAGVGLLLEEIAKNTSNKVRDPYIAELIKRGASETLITDIRHYLAKVDQWRKREVAATTTFGSKAKNAFRLATMPTQFTKEFNNQVGDSILDPLRQILDEATTVDSIARTPVEVEADSIVLDQQTKKLEAELKKIRASIDANKKVAVSKAKADPIIGGTIDFFVGMIAEAKKNMATTQVGINTYRGITSQYGGQTDVAKGKFRSTYNARAAAIKAGPGTKEEKAKELTALVPLYREAFNKMARQMAVDITKGQLTTSESTGAIAVSQAKFDAMLSALSEMKNFDGTNLLGYEEISRALKVLLSPGVDSVVSAVRAQTRGLFKGVDEAIRRAPSPVTADPVAPTTTPPTGYARGTDTVPAMLSPGEAVIPRDAVQHYGTDFMRKIINKRVPGYAKGGFIDGKPIPKHVMPPDAITGKDPARGRDRGKDGLGLVLDDINSRDQKRWWSSAGEQDRLNAEDYPARAWRARIEASKSDMPRPTGSANQARTQMTAISRARAAAAKARGHYNISPKSNPNGLRARGVRFARQAKYNMDSERVRFSDKFRGTGDRFKGQSARNLRMASMGRRSNRIEPMSKKRLPEAEIEKILMAMRNSADAAKPAGAVNPAAKPAGAVNPAAKPAGGNDNTIPSGDGAEEGDFDGMYSSVQFNENINRLLKMLERGAGAMENLPSNLERVMAKKDVPKAGPLAPAVVSNDRRGASVRAVS